MARLLLAAVCLTALIFGCFADKEYVEHGHHHHAHDGHDHHDHESHKKLFAGDDIGGNEAEQRERLRTLSKKIDTDKNGQISSDELRAYIAQRINEQRQREVDEFVGILDPEQTGKVDFDAYIKDNFGDLDIEKLEATAATDPRSRETRRTYIAEKKKWQYLDKDGDNLLTYEELRQFLRPEDIEDLRRIEIDSIINEYDLDKDNKISRDEYLTMTEAETGQAEALGEEIDKNNDGFGDFDELARYYLPLTSVVADEETEHLLKDCDTDKDGICTPDEIVNAYSSFAGSQITDFGADLENDREEL